MVNKYTKQNEWATIQKSRLSLYIHTQKFTKRTMSVNWQNEWRWYRWVHKNISHKGKNYTRFNCIEYTPK